MVQYLLCIDASVAVPHQQPSAKGVCGVCKHGIQYDAANAVRIKSGEFTPICILCYSELDPAAQVGDMRVLQDGENISFRKATLKYQSRRDRN